MVTAQTKTRRASGRRLIAHARQMRHEPTDAEHKLWSAVRGRAFGGYKFKRQYPIGPYIADFVCIACKVIIELDGSQHAQRSDYDAERTAYLRSRGFRVLRYWNDEFLRTPDVVLEDIWRALDASTPSAP